MIRFCLASLAAGGITAIYGIAAACPSLIEYDRFVCTPVSVYQLSFNQ